jgi:uncharacterized protein (DUF433 family)
LWASTLSCRPTARQAPVDRDCEQPRIRCSLAGKESAVFDRITFDRAIMGGRACIRGMRIPVSMIVAQIAHGATADEILEGYPDLEREDIQQALEYAAWLARDEVHIS